MESVCIYFFRQTYCEFFVFFNSQIFILTKRAHQEKLVLRWFTKLIFNARKVVIWSETLTKRLYRVGLKGVNVALGKLREYIRYFCIIVYFR